MVDARLAPTGISVSDSKSGRDDYVQINNFLKGKVITVGLLNFSSNCNTEVHLRADCKTGLEMTIFRYASTSDVEPFNLTNYFLLVLFGFLLSWLSP